MGLFHAAVSPQVEENHRDNHSSKERQFDEDNCPCFAERSTFFDGSYIDPIEEACLVLERTTFGTDMTFQYDLEENVVNWLLCSTEVEETDSSVPCSEVSNSSVESSSTSLNSPSRIWDINKIDLWLSLINLDEEDSKWVSYTESEMDAFQSEFPSPSFKSKFFPSKDVNSPSFENFSDDINTDEPLFWPSELKSEWSCENYFSMSPRRNIQNLGIPRRNFSSEAIGCRRRIVFGLGAASTILEGNHRSGRKRVEEIKTRPSRLSRLANMSTLK